MESKNRQESIVKFIQNVPSHEFHAWSHEHFKKAKQEKIVSFSGEVWEHFSDSSQMDDSVDKEDYIWLEMFDADKLKGMLGISHNTLSFWSLYRKLKTLL